MSVTSAEPVVFATAVEGTRKAYARRFTPELRAELKALGMDLEAIQAAYPLNTWLAAARLMGRAFFPELEEAERQRQLGREFMKGYVQTAIGFATLTTAKLIGVKRTLLRMGRNFRTAANYIEVDVLDVGPREVHLRAQVGEEFMPRVGPAANDIILHYRRGVLEETLVLLGVTGTVDVLEAPAQRPGGLFRITWS
ncbi:MAG: DUF2378 family protein [Myxococcales bacterium]|nr:DUF2378 family protein [Myxococcales bacterium]